MDFPWVVDKILKSAYENTAKKYDSISVIANSIGAYFTMNSLHDCKFEKALFISPIVNMEKLIYDMMSWANVTEEELCKKGEIPTDFGETLSWGYLQYVKKNPINWTAETKILYGGHDNLTSRNTIEDFAKKHSSVLTIMENGEHWFHTPEQVDFLDKWMKEYI